MDKILFLIFAPLLIIACNSKASSDNNPADTSAANQAVETKDPNSKYKPAFNGQTRAPGVKTSAPYEAKVLTDKLQSPWGITQLPDGRFLITQKEGTMRIVSGTGNLSDNITGIPPVNSAGQGGLLGITIDPQFVNNQMLYWCFSESTPEGNETAVAKGRLSKDERT